MARGGWGYGDGDADADGDGDGDVDVEDWEEGDMGRRVQDGDEGGNAGAQRGGGRWMRILGMRKFGVLCNNFR